MWRRVVLGASLLAATLASTATPPAHADGRHFSSRYVGNTTGVYQCSSDAETGPETMMCRHLEPNLTHMEFTITDDRLGSEVCARVEFSDGKIDLERHTVCGAGELGIPEEAVEFIARAVTQTATSGWMTAHVTERDGEVPPRRFTPRRVEHIYAGSGGACTTGTNGDVSVGTLLCIDEMEGSARAVIEVSDFVAPGPICGSASFRSEKDDDLGTERFCTSASFQVPADTSKLDVRIERFVEHSDPDRTPVAGRIIVDLS